MLEQSSFSLKKRLFSNFYKMNSKKLKTRGLLSIVVCLIILAYSCIKDKNEKWIMVEVESISIPNVAYVDDTVSVWLYGYSGAANCFSFGDANLYFQDDTTVIVEAQGVQGLCYEEVPRFSYEHIVVFEEPGVYTFITKRSDRFVEIGKIEIIIYDPEEPYIETVPFKAKVEGVFAPPVAFAEDSVSIYIYGYLGPTDCYIFDNAELHLQNNNNVLIEAFGIQKSGDIVCNNAASLLNYHELIIVFPEPGEYTFVTMLSNGLFELGKIVIEPKPKD